MHEGEGFVDRLRHPQRFLTHRDGLVEAPQLGETPGQERAGKLGWWPGLAEPLGRPRAREHGHDLLEELDAVREAAPAQRGDTEEEPRHHRQTVVSRRRAQRERPSAARDRFVLTPPSPLR